MRSLLVLPLLLPACAESGEDRRAGGDSADSVDSGDSVADTADSGDTAGDSGDSGDTGPPAPCVTRVSYGDRWIHDAATHPEWYDVADGRVTWDGTCVDDAYGNSSATLSNGWAPFFAGASGCVVGLDAASSCDDAPAGCQTLITYGPSWLPAPDHPDTFDLVDGRVFPASGCTDMGGGEYAQALSNGWVPWFAGGCALSFRYEQCGGLYQNPVVPVDCPDPAVLPTDEGYLMVCTGAGSAGVFPIRTSPDLVTWTEVGAVFPSPPAWASGDFWAPEVHVVGGRFVAYYTARAASDGQLSIGAAVSDSMTGPWTDLGGPLLHDGGMGLIDPHVHSTGGRSYLYWKRDGNAVGQPTPILGAELAADGLSVVGTAHTLITNDREWEGSVVEGPWVVEHDGAWFLFYSGNSYASAEYALGVARGTSPLGPFTKASAPILASANGWEGPGHGAVLLGPGGDWYAVVHAWVGGQVLGGPGRVVLLDQVQWVDGWPAVGGGPSAASRPYP